MQLIGLWWSSFLISLWNVFPFAMLLRQERKISPTSLFARRLGLSAYSAPMSIVGTDDDDDKR